MVIDVTAVACAVPAVAIAVVVVLLALRRPAAARPAYSARPRRSQPLPALLLGTIGLGWGGIMFARADADLEAYRSAPSCRAGLVLVAPLDGACAVSQATIESTYRTTGRGSRTHVEIALGDGTTVDVIERRVVSGAPVRGFRESADRSATVRTFHGEVVFVQTQSGAFETDAMPAARVDYYATLGIVFGLVGVIVTVLAAFAKPRVITAGVPGKR